MMVVASPPIPNPSHFSSSSSSSFLHSSNKTRFLQFFPNSPNPLIFRSKKVALISMASSSPSLIDAGTSDAQLKGPIPDITGESDLLIVGPGVLGRMVADKWRQGHPDSHIYGQTMTSDHHEELIKVGIRPSLRGIKPDNQFPYVIFCAPPSKTDDYPGDVRLAASNWNGEGSFLFTSSTAVYDCSDNGLCDEDSPLVPLGKSPRTDVLLKAENVVREVGGCVLRLAGLYKADRGAHTYWLEKGTVPYRPDHILNLIHYEDAASLAIAIMQKKFRGRTFLGCDNHPLSRQEIMDCVKRSGKFTKEFQAFTGMNPLLYYLMHLFSLLGESFPPSLGTDGPLGKRMNNSKTRAEIGWEPKYSSFAQFLGLAE